MQVTVRVALHAVVPPPPVQDVLYAVVCEGDTLRFPDAALPVEKLVPVHELAFVEDHVRVEFCPWTMEVGLSESEQVGAGCAPTLATTVVCQTPPVEPVQARV